MFPDDMRSKRVEWSSADASRSVSTWTVLDDDAHAEAFLELRGQGTGRQVGPAAGSRLNDEVNVLLREAGLFCGLLGSGRCGGC